MQKKYDLIQFSFSSDYWKFAIMFSIVDYVNNIMSTLDCNTNSQYICGIIVMLLTMEQPTGSKGWAKSITHTHTHTQTHTRAHTKSLS